MGCQACLQEQAPASVLAPSLSSSLVQASSPYHGTAHSGGAHGISQTRAGLGWEKFLLLEPMVPVQDYANQLQVGSEHEQRFC